METHSMRIVRSHPVAVIAAGLVAATGCGGGPGDTVGGPAADETPPATSPDAPPAVETRPDRSARDEPETDPESVQTLLETLEEAGQRLRAFTAAIHYQTEDALLDETVIRKGELLYRVDDDGADKSFAILFDTTIVDGRRRQRLKHYVFADGWLVEVDHQQKLFIKRQMVAPGETFDPLKLGEGPIPLPIGQPKDRVLARFEVERTQLPETGPLARLRDADPVDGLRLTPRTGTPEADDYQLIDVFYDRATRLPVGISVLETGGNRKTARLSDVELDPVLDETDLAKLSIEEPDPREWKIDLRPLEH